MSRRLIMQIISALAAYFGLTAAGWNGSDPTDVGAGISVNPDMMKLILSAVAAFIPQLADRFVPGLGSILSKVLDALLGKPKTEDGSTDVAVKSKANPFLDDMNNFKALSDRHATDPEAAEALGKLLQVITNYHVKGQGVQLVTNQSK